jgi:hypothetical protein
MNVALTTEDISKAIDRLCETYEGCGFARESIISELEMKVSELRGENHGDTAPDNPVAFHPLP